MKKQTDVCDFDFQDYFQDKLMAKDNVKDTL